MIQSLMIEKKKKKTDYIKENIYQKHESRKWKRENRSAAQTSPRKTGTIAIAIIVSTETCHNIFIHLKAKTTITSLISYREQNSLVTTSWRSLNVLYTKNKANYSERVSVKPLMGIIQTASIIHHQSWLLYDYDTNGKGHCIILQ